ncbi:ATP-binding protein [Peptococcaceae bacterium 1198_IL3148]
MFESVCAFLNRNDGHIFLGVKDNGAIAGIDKEAVETIKSNFVTSMNNPLKINPTFYLSVGTQGQVSCPTHWHFPSKNSRKA